MHIRVADIRHRLLALGLCAKVELETDVGRYLRHHAGVGGDKLPREGRDAGSVLSRMAFMADVMFRTSVDTSRGAAAMAHNENSVLFKVAYEARRANRNQASKIKHRTGLCRFGLGSACQA